MRCGTQLNALWLWWYCLLVLAVHGYLLYRAVTRCQTFNALPWMTDNKPVGELYCYIAMVVVSVMHIPYFVVSCFFKVNNYANDGIRLGRDNVFPQLSGQNEDDQPKPASSKMPKLWKHSGPICHLLHLSSAFFFLFPLVLVEAQEIKHKFLPTESVWWSELDVLFGKKRHDFGASASVQVRNGSSTNTLVAPPVNDVRYFAHVSPEFINFCLAFLIYSGRYISTFWFTHRGFTALFSVQLFVVVIHSLFAFNCFAILYKYQINAGLFPSVHLVLPGLATLALYFISATFMFSTSVVVFKYGYIHYKESYNRVLRERYPQLAQYAKPVIVFTGFQGYVPQIVATLILAAIVGCKAAIVYDSITLFRKYSEPVVLASTVMDVFFLLFWSVTWYYFTVKQKWDFYVAPAILSSVEQSHVPGMNGNVLNERTHRDVRAHVQPPSRTSSVSSAERDPVLPIAHAPLRVVLEEKEDEKQDNLSQVPDSPSPVLDQGESRGPTTGVLRKGREKKNGAAQRVTFEEDAHSLSADSDKNDVKRREKNRVHTERNSKGFSYPFIEKDPSESGNEREKPQRPQSVGFFRGLPIETTPENTLTRNYRHSLRDKCNVYYPDRQGSAAEITPGFVREPLRHSTSRISYPPSGERSPDKYPATRQDMQKINPSAPEPAGERPRSRAGPDHVEFAVAKPVKCIKQTDRTVSSPGPAKLMAGYSPNEELKLVLDKPVLGRRDSALPSSNDTSSNDSSDNSALCSFV